MKPTPVHFCISMSLCSLLNDLKFITNDENVAFNYQEKKNERVNLPSDITVDLISSYSKIVYFYFLAPRLQFRIKNTEEFISYRESASNYASRGKKLLSESE